MALRSYRTCRWILASPAVKDRFVGRLRDFRHVSRCISTSSENERRPATPQHLPLQVNQKKQTFMQEKIALIPGLASAIAVSGVSFWTADQLGSMLLSAQGITGGTSPLSGIPVAILLGLTLNNAVKLPASITPGLKYATTTVLRAGIVCVGAKLSAMDMVTLGAVGLPSVIASISAGLITATWLGKYLDISPKMTSLIAAGTSICGVTAITGLAPAIKAEQKDVAVAVANVVAFGTFGLLAYPYLAHSILENSVAIGTFLGLAVHDTSQVMGAALTYSQVYGDEVALKVAAITKLTRNLFLAAVIPGLSWKFLQGEKNLQSTDPIKHTNLLDKIQKYIPLFVLGFIGMAGFRTLGDYSLVHSGAALGVLDAENWKQTVDTIGKASPPLLGTAMAAVGLTMNMSVLKGVGWKPFALGFATASVVGGVGLVVPSIILAMQS